MKTDTESVDLLINSNNTIDVEAEIMPVTSNLTETTPKEESSIVTLTPIESGIQGALQHYGTIIQFVQQVFQKDVDFGTIPGTKKPTLYKSGAEKLVKLFGLHHRLELIGKIEDFTGKNYGLDFPLFTYHYKCQLLNRTGDIIAEGEATCSSTEYKYHKQGTQKIWDSQNTICKMAQKRALVAAVLIGVGASEFFTQDMEDFRDRIEQEPEPKPQPKGDKARDNLIAAIDDLKSKLKWSDVTAKAFAEKITNKKTRVEMNTGELYKLFEAMTKELEKIQNQQKAAS